MSLFCDNCNYKRNDMEKKDPRSSVKRQKTSHEKIDQLASDLFMLEEDFKDQKKEIEYYKEACRKLDKEIDGFKDEEKEYIRESNEQNYKIQDLYAQISQRDDKIEFLNKQIDTYKDEEKEYIKVSNDYYKQANELYGNINEQIAEHSKEIDFYKKELDSIVSFGDFSSSDQQYIINQIKNCYSEEFDSCDIKVMLINDKKEVVVTINKYVTKFPIKYNLSLDV